MNRPLTIDEAAEYFSVSVDTIKSLIKSGDLKAFTVNIGRLNQRQRLRIHMSSIREFEEARTVQPQAKLPRRKRDGFTLEDLRKQHASGRRKAAR